MIFILLPASLFSFCCWFLSLFLVTNSRIFHHDNQHRKNAIHLCPDNGLDTHYTYTDVSIGYWCIGVKNLIRFIFQMCKRKYPLHQCSQIRKHIVVRALIYFGVGIYVLCIKTWVFFVYCMRSVCVCALYSVDCTVCCVDILQQPKQQNITIHHPNIKYPPTNETLFLFVFSILTLNSKQFNVQEIFSPNHIWIVECFYFP